MAKVTVVILSYNRENYLKDCLESVLAQSFQDFEVIIFDNHSDYDIKKLIDSFTDHRIKLTINKTNLGALNNLNQALIYNYNTPYFIVFYDDDTMHPDLLSQEVALLDSHQDMLFAITGLNSIEDDNLMLNFSKIKNKSEVFIFSDYVDLVRLLLGHFSFCFDSIMFRSGISEEIISLDKRFFKWADRPYFIELAKKGKVGVIVEKLVNFRVHSGSSSQANHVGKFSYFIILYNYYRECLPQPLSRDDEKLFYSWSTNNLILAISWFSPNIKSYIKLFKQCRIENLFKFRYLNIRGLYYALIVMKIFLIK